MERESENSQLRDHPLLSVTNLTWSEWSTFGRGLFGLQSKICSTLNGSQNPDLVRFGLKERNLCYQTCIYVTNETPTKIIINPTVNLPLLWMIYLQYPYIFAETCLRTRRHYTYLYLETRDMFVRKYPGDEVWVRRIFIADFLLYFSWENRPVILQLLSTHHIIKETSIITAPFKAEKKSTSGFPFSPIFPITTPKTMANTVRPRRFSPSSDLVPASTVSEPA